MSELKPAYYLRDRTIHKAPREISRKIGVTTVSCGFPVCTVSEYCDAEILIAILEHNESRAPDTSAKVDLCQECKNDEVERHWHLANIMQIQKETLIEELSDILCANDGDYDRMASAAYDYIIEQARLSQPTAGVIPRRRPISVTMEFDYGECGHMDNGCSGWESVEVIATDDKRTESHKQGSCFGISELQCFEQVMNQWYADNIPPLSPQENE